MFCRPLVSRAQTALAVSWRSYSYVHPLTDAALQKLEVLSPPWFVKNDVVMDPKNGTFSLLFTDQAGTKGQLQTYFDKEARGHFLAVRFGALVGRVSLMDSSKSAWQSNIGDDHARVQSTVLELCTRIEDASKGILPGNEGASPTVDKPRGAAASIFPFPDNIRPPEG